MEGVNFMENSNIDKEINEINKQERNGYKKVKSEKRAMEKARLKAEEKKQAKLAEEARKKEIEQARLEKERQEELEKEKKINDYMKILLSDDPKLDSEFCKVEGIYVQGGLKDENFGKNEYLKKGSIRYITAREYVLSNIIDGKPCKLEPIHGKYNQYNFIMFVVTNVLEEEKETIPEIKVTEEAMKARKELAENDDSALDKSGTICLLDRPVKVSRRNIMRAGLDPNQFEWKPEITLKDLAELDKKSKLTTSLVGKVRGFFDKLRGKDEKEK